MLSIAYAIRTLTVIAITAIAASFTRSRSGRPLRADEIEALAVVPAASDVYTVERKVALGRLWGGERASPPPRNPEVAEPWKPTITHARTTFYDAPVRTPDVDPVEREKDRAHWLTCCRVGIEGLNSAQLIRAIRFARSHGMAGTDLVSDIATRLVRIELEGIGRE